MFFSISRKGACSFSSSSSSSSLKNRFFLDKFIKNTEIFKVFRVFFLKEIGFGPSFDDSFVYINKALHLRVFPLLSIGAVIETDFLFDA